jgi:predicted AAA+ superfamily ATPase
VEGLFERVQPRSDVLAGELTEARFAASLEEVVAGAAPDAYADAETFFAGTYPSGGLKSLLNEALGRIGGGKPDGASVIRLETNLGGGKTHNLIALFHAAGGQLTPEHAGEFMDPGLLPDQVVERIGVFVGTSAGAQSFPTIQGIAPRTVWGYLALQIGGADGYAHVSGDDEALTAPGSDALKKLIGDQPALLLVDEIARYYKVARGVRVGDTTLAGQTTAFLMALMEAVDALPNAVLVITTTGLTDAFGEETAEVLEAIGEARSLMARKELVLRPSEEADLPKILARRLFDPIPTGVAGPVAQAYAAATDAAFGAGLDLPEGMTGAGWATEITRTYPFHPALIRVLDKRLSTIPNFQRTRGALRLLARVVRQLWDEQHDSVQLIHLHHVDLADRVIAEELSSRLERPAYEPVIRADVASQPGGEPAHAERVDERMGAGYARRLAAAVYLYSLTREVPGVPAAELFGAVIAPGDDVNLLQKALDGLEGTCWYSATLRWASRRSSRSSRYSPKVLRAPAGTYTPTSAATDSPPRHR